MATLNPLSTTGLAEALGNLGNVSARPKFEVAFNAMQNTVIERLNKEIAKVQDEPVNNIDAFLVLEQKRLNRVLPYVEQYQTDNTNNRYRAAALLDKLDGLYALAGFGDEEGYNSLLSEVNDLAAGFIRVDGSALGIFSNDGLWTDVAANGLGLDSYASYPDTLSRLDAIETVQNKIQTALDVANLNADAADNFHSNVEEKLSTTALQIKATQAADQADKAKEIQKLRDKYAQLLNTISLAFETNQAQSEALNKSLLHTPDIPPGSVLNLFT